MSYPAFQQAFAEGRGGRWLPTRRIVNLASYAGERDGLNSDDPHVREETIQKQKEHILLAHDLDCRRARVFTGRERREETLEWNKAFEHSVIGFRELGEFAEKYGVTLLVENHPKSMAVSAQQTVNLVEAIGMKNVRILYDPSNLIVYAGEMDVERDFQLQRNYIAHVHVKDQVMLEDGRCVDAVPGRGAIPWKKILSLLKGIDYNGFLTMEYQRGWKSTGWLPDPEIGLKEGLEFLNRCLMNT